MADQRTIAPNEDPVCGMTPDPDQARAKGLVDHVRRARVRVLREGLLPRVRRRPREVPRGGLHARDVAGRAAPEDRPRQVAHCADGAAPPADPRRRRRAAHRRARHRLPRARGLGRRAAPATGSPPSRRCGAIDPDVIVLDVMLPGLDGVEVCRRLRTFSDAYVLMLTARGEEIDRIMGLTVGRGRLPREAVLAARGRGPRSRRCSGGRARAAPGRPDAGAIAAGGPAPAGLEIDAGRRTGPRRRRAGRAHRARVQPARASSRASPASSCRARPCSTRSVGPGVRRATTTSSTSTSPTSAASSATIRRARASSRRSAASATGCARRPDAALAPCAPACCVAFLVVVAAAHRHRRRRRHPRRPGLLHRGDGPPARRPDGRGDGRGDAGRLHGRDAPGPARRDGDRRDHAPRS